MNERIQKLAEQLGPVATIGNWGRVEWADNIYPQLGDKMYAAIDLEKFAELIVEECASQCWTVSELEHRGSVISECSKRIRKHFGVEL